MTTEGVSNRGSTSSSNVSKDFDSALYSMEDLPKFTRSTAKLELSGDDTMNEAQYVYFLILSVCI